MRPHTFARQDRRERAPLPSAFPVERQLCAGNRGNPGNLQGTGMWQPRALAATRGAPARPRQLFSFQRLILPRPRLRSAMAQVIPVGALARVGLCWRQGTRRHTAEHDLALVVVGVRVARAPAVDVGHPERARLRVAREGVDLVAPMLVKAEVESTV